MIKVITSTDNSSRAKYRVYEDGTLIGSGWVGVWSNSRRSGAPGIRGYNTAHKTAAREARVFLQHRFNGTVPCTFVREGRDWMNLA